MQNFKNKLWQFLLILMVVTMSAFTYTPPTHYLPERNKEVPVLMWEMPGNPTLTLSASSSAANTGEAVCIAVTAKDFQQILSMQFSMKWDNSVMKFKEIKSLGLKGMSAANFGTHLAEDKGILTFFWYDPNLTGVTKDDGVQLFELCFEAVGKPGSRTEFEFTEKPTIVEISNAAGMFLQLKKENGVVTID